MSELPAGLAEPLHILEPSSPSYGPWLLLALLLAWWWWRRRRRRVVVPPPRVTVPVAPSEPELSGLAAAIESILKRFGGPDADHREGCHQLARELRRHFHDGRRPFAVWTAREIVARATSAQTIEKRVARLFECLAELQFRRRPPEREELTSVLASAGRLVGDSDAATRSEGES